MLAPLVAGSSQARLLSQLQDDGGDAAATLAPTLDEQLQAAYVPLTGSSACERLP